MEEPSSKALSCSPDERAPENLSSMEASVPAEETTFPDHLESRLCVLNNIENCIEDTRSSLPDSNVVQIIENETVNSSEIIANGIASILGPVMKNFDAEVEGALKSQSVLASSIDRLTRELDKLLEDAPLPFVAQHATKLSGVRKRVLSLNTSLHIIQKRIDSIERLLSGYALKTSGKGKQVRVPSLDIKQSSINASTSQPALIRSSSVEVSPVETLSTGSSNTHVSGPGQDELYDENQQTISTGHNIDGIPELEESQTQGSIKDSVHSLNGSDLNGFTESSPLERQAA